MAFTKVVGPGIHTLSNIASHNINSSGIITATKFVGPFDNAIIGGGTTISSDGINVTGIVTATGLDINGNGDISGNLVIGGNLTANGDFTTLNTTLREVELLRVDATSSLAAGIITQRSSGNILDLYDTSTNVLSVKDGGDLDIAQYVRHLGSTGETFGFPATGNRIIATTNGSTRLTLDGDGRILVGITTATFIAQGGSDLLIEKAVGAGGTVSIDLYSKNATGNAFLRFYNGSQSGKIGIVGIGHSMIFCVQGVNSERMRLTSTGLGIGTTIPTAKLDVVGGIKADGTIRLDNNASPTLYLTSTSATGDGRIFFGDPDSDLVGRLSYVHNGDYFTFYAAYGERFRIDGSGDITATSISGGAVGPTLKLFHNSGSPAADDVVSRISMFGDDSAGNETEYGRIETKVDNVTDSQETAHINFATRGLGSFANVFRIKRRSTGSAPSYTTDDADGMILDVYNTGNPYPRYMNFIAKSAGNTDSNIGFWTEAVGGSPTEKLRISSTGALTSTGTGATLNLTNSGSSTTEQTATFLASNSGTHNRVLIKTSTNNGGDPYIKFDAGGQDMIVGTRYAGTTNNLLVMGPGLDPDDASSGIFVKGTGVVGIGTDNPGQKLHVEGGSIRIRGTGSNETNGQVDFGDDYRILKYTDQNTMTLQSPGNVVIGVDNNNNSTDGFFSVIKDRTNADGGGTDLFRVRENGAIVASNFSGSHSSGTIRKIFIYDTRMDSDGGAWRKSERIKTTSWYTETLGTSKRGTRAEFPVVAVLVLENYKLTIYDGDDPAMPMWMVFDRGPDNASTNWWDGNNSNYGTDIHMLNGYMFMTTHAAGSYTANFISEEMRTYYSSSYSGVRTGNTIADRNNQSFTVRLGQDNVGGQEVGQYAESVDMMVMDNSKVDPQTGLKQPHVLVGCSNDANNHICIIGDDQLVLVRRTATWSGTGGCYEARFDHVHGGYWHSTGYHPQTSGSYPNHGGNIGYTDIITTSGGVPTMNVNARSIYIVGAGKGKDNTPPQLTGVYQHEGSYWTSGSVCNFWLPNPQSSNPGKMTIARNGKYIANEHGLLVMSHHLEEFGEGWNTSHTKAERTGQARKSLHAYIYKDSATGYLFGNDKGCYGHSTSTTSLQGWTSSSPNTNQLVTDPTFEDGANWTHIQPSAGVTHDTNTNTVTCTSSGNSNIYSARQVTGLTAGQKYLLRLDYKRPSGTASTGIIIHDGVYNSTGSSYAGSNTLPTRNNVYRSISMEFEPNNTSIWLNVYAQGTIVIDNFFIMSTNGYERSLAYPARGAQVYGTITRTAVASGAELTMLGNTDNSANYLMEKNIDIDFSQDWYLMCWCPKGNGKVSIEEFNSDSTYNNTVAYINMANGNESSIRYAGSPMTGHTSQYYKFHCVTHEGATNTTRYYVGPGHLLQSGTQADWSSSKEADLHIGRNSYNGTYSHTAGGSNSGVSLVRYGQGLPQKEHLEKIYYDELKLMQPNAKCTLYGTSNNIRSIAWDKCTDITHVGTSSGRSDFLGLERINNTTTAVGEGMDAKNGLIVEAN